MKEKPPVAPSFGYAGLNARETVSNSPARNSLIIGRSKAYVFRRAGDKVLQIKDRALEAHVLEHDPSGDRKVRFLFQPITRSSYWAALQLQSTPLRVQRPDLPDTNRSSYNSDLDRRKGAGDWRRGGGELCTKHHLCNVASFHLSPPGCTVARENSNEDPPLS